MYCGMCRLLSTLLAITVFHAAPAMALTTAQVRYQADPYGTGIALDMAMEMVAMGMTRDDHIKGGPYACRRTTRSRGSCRLVLWSTAYPGSVCRSTVVVTQRGNRLDSRAAPAVCEFPA